jgi:mRNA interferase MazF
MKPGDVCLALFPFGGAGGRKLRPVLLLTGRVGGVPEYVVAYISSAAPADALPSDLWIDPANPADGKTGLSVRSVVRLHKLSTLHQRDLVRLMGAVSPLLLDEAKAKLRDLLFA